VAIARESYNEACYKYHKWRNENIRRITYGLEKAGRLPGSVSPFVAPLLKLRLKVPRDQEPTEFVLDSRRHRAFETVLYRDWRMEAVQI